jgi:hypothetical protein
MCIGQVRLLLSKVITRPISHSECAAREERLVRALTPTSFS